MANFTTPLQARVVQLVARRLAVPEFQVQTPHGENWFKQIVLRIVALFTENSPSCLVLGL